MEVMMSRWFGSASLLFLALCGTACGPTFDSGHETGCTEGDDDGYKSGYASGYSCAEDKFGEYSGFAEYATQGPEPTCDGSGCEFYRGWLEGYVDCYAAGYDEGWLDGGNDGACE